MNTSNIGFIKQADSLTNFQTINGFYDVFADSSKK